jgi:hypothetical protein
MTNSNRLRVEMETCATSLVKLLDKINARITEAQIGHDFAAARDLMKLSERLSFQLAILDRKQIGVVDGSPEMATAINEFKDINKKMEDMIVANQKLTQFLITVATIADALAGVIGMLA